MKTENKYIVFTIKDKAFKFRQEYLNTRKDVFEWLKKLENTKEIEKNKLLKSS